MIYDIDKKIASNKRHGFVEEHEYTWTVEIYGLMQEKKWEEAEAKTKELLADFLHFQRGEMYSHLKDMIYTILLIREEGLLGEDDRIYKLRECRRHFDEIAYLMTIQPLFTKEYVLTHIWPKCWRDAKDIIEDKNTKINYVLTWDDVFYTDYFPVNPNPVIPQKAQKNG
jgi:hypothetical protein